MEHRREHHAHKAKGLLHWRCALTVSALSAALLLEP